MGNKINVKEKFNTIVTNQSPDIVKETKELLSADCTDQHFKISISPFSIRKTIDEKPNIFHLVLNEVKLGINISIT